MTYKGSNIKIKKYHNNSKIKLKGGEIMAIITNLVNKLKMRNTKETNPGNVYIPNDFEVEERKKDVDANEK
jgi:hypothetical protein